MKIRTAFILSALAFVSLTASCAREKDESSRSISQRILDAYIAQNCPNAIKRESGLTIIDSSQTGSSITPVIGNACYVHYSTYSLDGTCQSTTDSLLARKLGTFGYSKYYGPQLFILFQGQTTSGMIELLTLMKEGGTAKVIMPPWLSSAASYYGTSTTTGLESSMNMIYDIKVGKVITNMEQFIGDSLESYADKKFPELRLPGDDRILDTLKNKLMSWGYYFYNYTHPDGIPAADTIASGKSVNVYYIGRLLDGYVFDTNIADSAKKFRIYDASKTYSALSVTYADTYENMAQNYASSSSNGLSTSSSTDGSSGLILGFARAIKNTTTGDRAVTFFAPGYGYGSTSKVTNGVGTPAYSMLRFDIWVEAKE